MTTESEIHDFHILIVRRFKGISTHWENASNNYHNLDGFLIYLNSTIQELRNITFLLQSYKWLYSDFDSWYEQKREIMKADENLRWLHEARTKVVKQKGLEIESVAKVALMNWEKVDLLELRLNPLFSDQELISLFSEFIKEKFFINLGESQWKPLVRVKRIWIDSEYKKKELLELLGYWYGFLRELFREFFELNWVKELGVEELNFPDLEEKQEFLFDISTGKYIKAAIRTITRESISKEIHKESAEIFSVIKRGDTEDKIKDLIYYHLDLNKLILTKQPELLPTCILLGDNLEMIDVKFFPFTNRTEKYWAVREIAKYAHRNSKVTAVLFIGEIWIVDIENFDKHYKNPSLNTAKWEALSLSFMNNKGLVRNIFLPIHRNSWGITFWKLTDESWWVKEDTERSWMILPFAEMWWLLK